MPGLLAEITLVENAINRDSDVEEFGPEGPPALVPWLDGVGAYSPISILRKRVVSSPV